MQDSPAPFVLASVLTSYPMADQIDNLSVLLNDPDVSMPDGLRDLILAKTGPGQLEDLQSEYISIFDSGRAANPIYETEYDRRRSMSKGQDLSDIAGFYKAFGFELDTTQEGMEMLDHVAIELEFYALMLMKQIQLTENNDADGVEIVGDGSRKFLKAHLGRFVGAISRRPGVSQSEFYGPIFNWCTDLVAKECQRLNLEVIPADWVDGEEVKEEEMNCQIGAAPVK
jgi:nitrate reductase assembly molybdenum cofactor insertion protein NarJ